MERERKEGSRRVRRPKQPIPPPVSPEVRPDSQFGIAVGPKFAPEIVNMPPGSPAMRIVEGNIQLDQQALSLEINSVTEWLTNGLAVGDSKALEVYNRNLIDPEDSSDILPQSAPNQLDSLSVMNVDIQGIAERNLIRSGLTAEIPKLPFTFHDANDQELSMDDLDIVFAKKEGRKSGYKLIIGSKKGIKTIAVPQEPSADKFAPDLNGLDKDADRDIRIFPLGSSPDGYPPSADIVDIHIGPVDVISELEEQERKGRAKAASSRSSSSSSSSSYSPPSYPSTPSSSSSSRESYGYTRVSG